MRQPTLLSIIGILFVASAAVVLAEDDYAKVLGMSYEFYQGQMSGLLPNWNVLLYSKGGWKKSAHLNDGAPIGKDLSGGFYDAGDYLKCPHALAWGVSNLIFSMLEFKPAYDAARQYTTALNTVKWALDWLIKAHVSAGSSPSSNAFVGQIADNDDHQYFGRPEHATNSRPVYLADSSKPGADLAGEYAAAYAAGAVLFKNSDPAYAATLFSHAQQAFAFADAYRSNWKTPAGVFQAYGSYWPEGYIAHLAWASAWMCKYSSSSCSTAQQWFSTAMNTNNLRYGLGYDWDSTLPGAAALIVSMNLPGAADQAKTYLEGYVLSKWQDTSSRCPKPSYSTVCYTSKGLAYYSDWGTLRNTGNMMFIASLMGKYGNNKGANLCFARNQMRYILGSDTGKSYLIGFGTNQPQRPHHRQSACNARYSEPCSASNGGTCCAGERGIGAGGCCTEANFMDSHPALIVLRGGLVGGPDQSDNYPDVRNDYQRSEVAIDYNAGFTGAAAGLAQAALDGFAFSSCGGGSGPAPPPTTPPPTPPTTPPPSPPSGGGGGSCTLAAWTQCGGKSGCPSGTCQDAAWSGVCCSGSAKCVRGNEWYWQCTPAARSMAHSPLSPDSAVSTAVPASVDDLQLVAPAVAAAGVPVTVTAVLTRNGAPVRRTVVTFKVDSAGTMAGGADLSVEAAAASPVAFMTAMTGLDGRASVVLPPGVGVPGTSTLVTSSVDKGRAVGVKGYIPVMSPDAIITWQ